MSSQIQQRLIALGIELPAMQPTVANYVPATFHRGVLTLSGQLPRTASGLVKGKVGGDMTVEQGVEAARLCGIALLAAAKVALDGDLDRIESCLTLGGFVNAVDDFEAHPQVINGASDLIVDVLGDCGRHARVALGVASLPLGAAVEVSASFAVRD
ncbi:RidA family protein [Sphingobium fluviale]|uniref:RidA family protein n=1 Tax=Sphingobium fluviale TaxID=2506423 RepID=A0A4Q1KCZ8_9SPHN|nr:RidA family protein [Sphingobium fluviale]RXR25209.1 RidA family protein [Sphingobium fluviale]